MGCQLAHQMLHPIFVLHRLTHHYLAAAAGSKAAENRYTNLRLASFVYILEDGVISVSKQ